MLYRKRERASRTTFRRQDHVLRNNDQVCGERADRVRAAYINGGASSVLRVLAEFEGEYEEGLLGRCGTVADPVVDDVGARGKKIPDVAGSNRVNDPRFLGR